MPEILSRIAILVESQCPTEAWCSISVLTDEQPAMKLMAAPSIPEDFITALSELHVSETDGTCGKARSSGQTVIAENILADPDFEVFQELALQSGILASSSLPVFSSSGEIIAIITNFYHGTHRPNENEIRRNEDLRNLVSLAIEKTSAVQELADSNIRFQSVAATTNDAVWDWDIMTDTLWWNDGFSKLFGFQGEGNGPSVEGWAERVHPADRSRVYSSLCKAPSSKKKHWAEDYRFFRNDGSTAHVLDQAEIIRNDSGKAIRMIGGMRDISAYTEAKQELTALNRSLEMLRSCNKILIRATDEKHLLTDVCRIAAEVGGYKLSWVGYAEKGKGMRIIPAAHYGEESGYLTEIQISYSEDDVTGNGPAGRTLRDGEPVICEDIRQEDDFFWKSSAIERGLFSVVCLPLKNSDGCFGFISLMSGKASSVGKDELELLTELADNLSFGISSIRNRKREETLRDAIFKVASSVADTVGNRFYETLTLNMVETLGASAGLIGKIPRGDETVNSLSYVLNGKVMKNFTYSLAGTPCEQVESGDVCIFANGIQELFPEDHALVELGAESYAGIALLDNENRRSGIISVLFNKQIEDPSLVMSILRIFGERAASEMEREHAENLLVEQASLLDKARDAILTFDLDHRITFLNSSAEELYGYSFFEAPGKSIRKLLHENTSAYDAAYSHTLEHGEWLGELSQIDKDKNPVIVESRWNLVRGDDGEPASILSINTDVTRHRNLEQAFFRAQRLESIGTLAGGVAHDLNNVLTPISMSIELLRGSISDERGKDLLDTIAKSSKRGAEMVGQILSFARGIESRQNYVSGKELFDSIHGIIRDTFPKSISIKFHIAPGLWPIIGDSTQLHQVLLNLCLNARDAMPDGGTLCLNAMNQRIGVDDEPGTLGIKPGCFVRIDVEDTGHGIPFEIQGKIYEPFFTTKEVGKGSGLGLSTSLNIVRNHGGIIQAYSEPRRGTGFRLLLPALTSFNNGSIPVHHEEIRTLPAGNGETVLIVDDEPKIVGMMAMTLEKYGYIPISATSGPQGSQIYAERSTEIDAVITDMMMPILNGASLIRQIITTNPNTAVIAASGIAAQEESAIAAGCKPGNFLMKPFLTEDLLFTLQRALTK
ncbi:MAG: GAF domain-containing protein [Akkermansiaceae bacterium]|nr:GAF domain-containing protein [Akkermansiaceae bacterium]